jgi:predicted lipoprotein
VWANVTQCASLAAAGAVTRPLTALPQPASATATTSAAVTGTIHEAERRSRSIHIEYTVPTQTAIPGDSFLAGYSLASCLWLIATAACWC